MGQTERHIVISYRYISCTCLMRFAKQKKNRHTFKLLFTFFQWKVPTHTKVKSFNTNFVHVNCGCLSSKKITPMNFRAISSRFHRYDNIEINTFRCFFLLWFIKHDVNALSVAISSFK